MRWGRLFAMALLLAPQLAHASNCYIKEYRSEASIGSLAVPIAPETTAVTDQAPVAIGGTAASSAAFQSTTGLVRIVCGASVSFAFGTSPTATTSNSVLPSLLPEYFAVVPGQSVSFISNASP